jgi:hypothetical protein
MIFIAYFVTGIAIAVILAFTAIFIKTVYDYLTDKKGSEDMCYDSLGRNLHDMEAVQVWRRRAEWAESRLENLTKNQYCKVEDKLPSTKGQYVVIGKAFSTSDTSKIAMCTFDPNMGWSGNCDYVTAWREFNEDENNLLKEAVKKSK